MTQQEQLLIVSDLRQKNIFYSLDYKNLSRQGGFVAIFCPDCAVSHDKLTHLFSFEKRIYLLGYHGGGCVLGKPSEAVTIGKDIRLIAKNKNLKLLILVSHFPCDWIGRQQLTIFDQLILLTQAIDNTDFASRDNKIISLFHVNYGHKMRTYGVDIGELKKYL